MENKYEFERLKCREILKKKNKNKNYNGILRKWLTAQNIDFYFTLWLHSTNISIRGAHAHAHCLCETYKYKLSA